jgi:uncharacterized membrane protein
MSRKHWHALLVTLVVVLFALALAFYVTSIVLAPSRGNDTAGLFDGFAMFALVAGIAVGIVDFFVRPLGGDSGTREVREAVAEEERVRTGTVRTHPGR